MEARILLAQLRALIERTPDFGQYSPSSHEHAVWLGQAHALIARWNQNESYGLKLAQGNLTNSLMREFGLGTIFGTIHRAIADLELSVPDSSEGVYAPGEVYSFFKDLNRIIGSAEESLFIIDPYIDNTVFDHYLQSRESKVRTRLLVGKSDAALLAAAEKYRSQHGQVLDQRKSKEIHDRLIFVDKYVCWTTGQSLKDAARAKPTYLVQLPPDLVSAKLAAYEAIWANAGQL